jgi:hypothetical protein
LGAAAFSHPPQIQEKFPLKHRLAAEKSAGGAPIAKARSNNRRTKRPGKV